MVYNMYILYTLIHTDYYWLLPVCGPLVTHWGTVLHRGGNATQLTDYYDNCEEYMVLLIFFTSDIVIQYTSGL